MPALWFGSAGINKLLVLSQVVLGLQLPLAVIPLLWLTTRRRCLGALAFSPRMGGILWMVAAVLIAGDVGLIVRFT